MVEENLIPIGSYSGIYIILIDKDFYIGSSKNINKRVTEHKRLLNNNSHYNKLMQKAYNITNNLVAYCIKEVNEEELFKEEQIFLDKYCPTLNISTSAYIPRLSKEAIMAKQGGSRNHKAVITLDMAINIVRLRNTGLTLKEVSETSKVSLGTCTSICSGINWKDELLANYPNEVTLMLNNRTKLGKINKGRNTVNKLFNDTKLLEVLHMIISRKYTLEEIGDKFNTDKTVISGIKNITTYTKDISRLLSKEELDKLKSIPKGSLKI